MSSSDVSLEVNVDQTRQMKTSISSFGQRLGVSLVVAGVCVMAVPSTSIAAGKAVNLNNVGKATTASPTLQYSMTNDMSFTVGGKSVSGKLTATGKVDRAKKASSIDLDSGDFMKKVSAASGQPLPKELSDPDLFKIKVIAVDTKIWMNYPLMSSISGTSTKGKPWVLIDAAAMGVDAGDVVGSQGADPTQGLDMLVGLGATAIEAGKEKVRGVETTKYTATVELDALLKNTPAVDQAQARAMFGTKKSIPVSVWVDSEQRARRFELTLDLDNQGQKVAVKSTYEFFAFGEAVTITPPPASQVGENPALASIIAQAAAKKAAAAKVPAKKAA